MPRLSTAVFALAAAFLPAVYANETDCNVSGLVLFDNTGRTSVGTVTTDFDTTRYDVSARGATSDVYLQVNQNSASTAQFTVSLNNNIVNTTPGDVDNSRVAASGFDTTCGAENIFVVEVAEVKNAQQRYDSCNFKYEVHFTNAC